MADDEPTTAATHEDAHERLESWFGIINSQDDALRIIEAARTGKLPRITRKLTDAERMSIVRSGAVFVFEESESQLRRWTDTRFWSSSRMQGNFLIYTELLEEEDENADRPEGNLSAASRDLSPGGGGSSHDSEDHELLPPPPSSSFSTNTRSPILGRPAQSRLRDSARSTPRGSPTPTPTPVIATTSASSSGGKKRRVRGDLKKRALSLVTQHGQKLRMISYYYPGDASLPTVSSDPRIADLPVPVNYYWAGGEIPLRLTSDMAGIAPPPPAARRSNKRDNASASSRSRPGARVAAAAAASMFERPPAISGVIVSPSPPPPAQPQHQRVPAHSSPSLAPPPPPPIESPLFEAAPPPATVHNRHQRETMSPSYGTHPPTPQSATYLPAYPTHESQHYQYAAAGAADSYYHHSHLQRQYEQQQQQQMQMHMQQGYAPDRRQSMGSLAHYQHQYQYQQHYPATLAAAGVYPPPAAYTSPLPAGHASAAVSGPTFEQPSLSSSGRGGRSYSMGHAMHSRPTFTSPPPPPTSSVAVAAFPLVGGGGHLTPPTSATASVPRFTPAPLSPPAGSAAAAAAPHHRYHQATSRSPVQLPFVPPGARVDTAMVAMDAEDGRQLRKLNVAAAGTGGGHIGFASASPPEDRSSRSDWMDAQQAYRSD